MPTASRMATPRSAAAPPPGALPIVIAFSGDQEPPIVIDFATCAAAYGKLEIARRKNESIPRGWAIDKDGQDTEDPQAMMDGGAILPLGSDRPRGGHKGYAM